MGLKEYNDDKPGTQRRKMFDEFDCPVCNANNPYPDGFREREEIRCFYCGTSFRVAVTESGKLKLKEL